MSKPDPIHYVLHSWEMRFSNAKGSLVSERRYEVKILWEAIVPSGRGYGSEVLTSREDKSFMTFDEAKEWIDAQLQSEGGDDE